VGAVPSKKNGDLEGVIATSALPCAPEHVKTSFERLHIRINQTDLLVDQIVRQIVDACAMGALAPNERLPSVGDAARHIGVGPTTIRDVYQMLAQYGITSTTQRGTFLTPTAERAACRYLLSCSARTLISKARSLHLRDEEIIAVMLSELSAQSAETMGNKTGTIRPDEMR
jgi:DNA-binding transcriptional regulator YhcF (GntR family)